MQIPTVTDPLWRTHPERYRKCSICQLKVSEPVEVGDEVYAIRPQDREHALAIHSLPNETLIGEVQHYYGRIRVASVVLTRPLALNNTIRIRGRSTDFIQAVCSMERGRVPVEQSDGGSLVGLRVSQPVREHDLVYRLPAGIVE
jgi:hypothetical protein